ncbi:MAG: ROK family protein [Microbacterium sp.]
MTAAVLRDHPPGPLFAGLDIGGTKIQGVVVDQVGTILATHTVPTVPGPAGIITGTTHVYAELRDQLGGAPICALGVGVPGTVSPDGRVDHAVHVGLDGFDLRAALADALETTVTVDNDVNVAALGAAADAGSTRSLALLNVGTGLAVGIVMDGTIYHGSTGVVGEIGHLPVDPTGPACGCGQRGCLELYLSGSGIARMWPTPSPHAAHDLFAAAATGDADAVAIVEAFTDRLAWAIQLIAVAIDVDAIVLGGGVTALGAAVMDPLHARLRTQAAQSRFVASMNLADRTRSIRPGFPVAAAGAALHGAAHARSRPSPAVPTPVNAD